MTSPQLLLLLGVRPRPVMDPKLPPVASLVTTFLGGSQATVVPLSLSLPADPPRIRFLVVVYDCALIQQVFQGS